MNKKREAVLKDYFPGLNLLPDFIFKWLMRKELAKFCGGECWGRPTIYSTDDCRLIIINPNVRNSIRLFGKLIPANVVTDFFRNLFQAEAHYLSDGGINIYFTKETKNPYQTKLPFHWQ